ncbi:MAG: hypothetical protein WCP32_15170 [Bacteroidota bacterium]
MYLILAIVFPFFVILVLLSLKNSVVRFFRKRYISLVYGRYSHQFLTFFRENDLVTPYNGCIKDGITWHFIVFYKKIKNSQEFQTDIPIDYGEIPFMASCKNLLKIKGNPDCIDVDTINDIKFLVVGYNETLQGLKMKSMYYFLNDQFVLGELNFANLLHVKPTNLVGQISSKYLNGNPVEKDVFYIADTTGNQLNYENNGFSISIKYLFKGNNATNLILSGLFGIGDNTVENKIKALRNKELLDRL